MPCVTLSRTTRNHCRQCGNLKTENCVSVSRTFVPRCLTFCAVAYMKMCKSHGADIPFIQQFIVVWDVCTSKTEIYGNHYAKTIYGTQRTTMLNTFCISL